MPAEKESYARRFRWRRRRDLMIALFRWSGGARLNFPLQVQQAKKKAGAWHLPFSIDCRLVRLTF